MFWGPFQLKPKSTPVIHGVTESGKPVTLLGCLTYSRHICAPGIPKEAATADYLCIGTHLEEIDHLKFTKATFAIEGLDQWLGLTGISVSHEWDDRRLKQTTIIYRPLPVQTHNLSGGLNLSISYRSTIPTSAGSNIDARVAQSAYFEITTDTPTRFSDLLRVIHQVNTFLCFAVDEVVALTSIEVSSSEISKEFGDTTRPVDIQVFFASLPHSEKSPQIDSLRLLFPYTVIASNFSEVISTWLADYEILAPAFNLYFAATTARQAYIETRFLFLIQGLETFHRRTSDETVMPGHEFQDVIRILVSACPPNHIKWLKTRLTYANELSLRHRLRALINPISHYFGEPSRVSALVNEIVTTRNLLTHYDKSSKQPAISGEILLKLSMQLEAIFTLLFLRRLGFTSDQLDNLVRENFRLTHKIKGRV